MNVGKIEDIEIEPEQKFELPKIIEPKLEILKEAAPEPIKLPEPIKVPEPVKVLEPVKVPEPVKVISATISTQCDI